MESRSDLFETVAAERESVDSDTLGQGAAEHRHSSHIEAPVLTRSEDQVTVLDRVEWASSLLRVDLSSRSLLKLPNKFVRSRHLKTNFGSYMMVTANKLSG